MLTRFITTCSIADIQTRSKENKMNEQAMKGLAEYREKVASGEIEVVRLNPIEKSNANPTSLRLVINAMCFFVLRQYRFSTRDSRLHS